MVQFLDFIPMFLLRLHHNKNCVCSSFPQPECKLHIISYYLLRDPCLKHT